MSIVFLDSSTSEETLRNYVKRLKVNFVFQKVIKNHPSFAAANPFSLNTLRIVTLVHHNSIKLIGATLRMGNDKKIDNWDAGGFICEVGIDGCCKEFAVNGAGEKVFVHPNGFRFAGHKLYRADEAIQMAIKCHHRIPQQKYISWDFTVDDKGEIIFIEMNSPGGSELLQVLGINAYGNKEIVKEILDKYLVESFFYLKANFDWNYREFSDHVSLLKYCGGKETVEVPDQIDGKETRIVYADAFDFANVKKIVISKKVVFNTSLATRAKVSIIYK